MSIWRRKYDRVKIGRKQYRLEYNWNSLCACLENENLNFGQLSELEKPTPSQFISLLYEGLIEGSRLENKKFPYSKEEFAAMLTPESIADLSLVFQSKNAIRKPEMQKNT